MGEEDMPEKGSLAWIHKHNQGSPVFGDPDNMINTMTIKPEAFDAFQTVSVMVKGEPEEVMVDDNFGPLNLQMNGDALFQELIRDKKLWKNYSSTEKAVGIETAAKRNRQIKERRLEKMIEVQWGSK
mmetsp:Transcript_85873/g.148700  ORF Transcript_85873/g.148700 Transcript_85873/m.148700 type:complete len:127 (+) Transcript_85873:103-483(+)